MECKNCGSVLKEGQTVCHCCGEPIKEKKRKKPWTKKRIAKLVIGIVAGLLVLALVTGILVLALRKNDVHYKSAYTTSDFWSKLTKNQVVATMGDYKLTNSQLQVFYWMHVYDFINYYVEQYGDYAVYYLGIDMDKPLSEQPYTANTDMTWEQYFLEDSLNAWHRYQSLADEAKKAGYQMSAEYQKVFAELYDSMAESAKEGGYDSVDAMLQADLGSTVTFDDYYYYMEMYYLGNMYFSELVSKLVFTDAELDAYYEKNKESLQGYGVNKDDSILVNFRNVLVKPVATKDDIGNSVITDEAWNDCRAKAQTIMDILQGGELNEDTFAALAEAKSEDTNSASNGGLYQYVGKNDLATVDVRHILIMPKDGTKDESGNVTYSEEEWESCRIAAQELFDQYLAGEKTEAAFGAMANEYSEDQDGNVTNGGLYEDVYLGEMVEPFEEWIFDGNRQPGDTGLIKTRYGYHIMYFVERSDAMEQWLFAEGRKGGDMEMIKTEEGYQIVYYVGDDIKWEVWCENGLKNQTAEEMMQSYADARPMKARYWAVMFSNAPETESE